MQNYIAKRNIQKQFYKISKAFSSEWTSNAQTGEVMTRASRQMKVGTPNAFSLFNRNKAVKSLSKQTHFQTTHPENQKDFPSISERIAFLTGKKI